MKEQAITNMVEGLAELHVEHLKTRNEKGRQFYSLSSQNGKRA